MAIAASVGDIRSHQEPQKSHLRLNHHHNSSVVANPEDNDDMIRRMQEQQHCLPCGACSCCADTCEGSACSYCANKHLHVLPDGAESMSCEIICPNNNDNNDESSSLQVRSFTMCQIRKHNTEASAWLVVGDDIYDATAYLNSHPGGKNSILRKAGGKCDCTEDFNFHSKGGRRIWKKCYVGKLRKCPSQGVTAQKDRQWWMFWM